MFIALYRIFSQAILTNLNPKTRKPWVNNPTKAQCDTIDCNGWMIEGAAQEQLGGRLGENHAHSSGCRRVRLIAVAFGLLVRGIGPSEGTRMARAFKWTYELGAGDRGGRGAT